MVHKPERDVYYSQLNLRYEVKLHYRKILAENSQSPYKYNSLIVSTSTIHPSMLTMMLTINEMGRFDITLLSPPYSSSWQLTLPGSTKGTLVVQKEPKHYDLTYYKV